MKTGKRKTNALILDYVKFHVSRGNVTADWIVKMLNQVKP